MRRVFEILICVWVERGTQADESDVKVDMIMTEEAEPDGIGLADSSHSNPQNFEQQYYCDI